MVEYTPTTIAEIQNAIALQASEAFAIPGLRFSRRANGGGDGVVSYLVGVEGFGLNEGLGGEKDT